MNRLRVKPSREPLAARSNCVRQAEDRREARSIGSTATSCWRSTRSRRAVRPEDAATAAATSAVSSFRTPPAESPSLPRPFGRMRWARTGRSRRRARARSSPFAGTANAFGQPLFGAFYYVWGLGAIEPRRSCSSSSRQGATGDPRSASSSSHPLPGSRLIAITRRSSASRVAVGWWIAGF